MKINVIINYPKDMGYLKERTSEILAEIFMKKLNKKELYELIEKLKEDKSKMQL